MTPIEYIGPAPKKKPKKPILGGWIILCLAGAFVSYFAWPHFGPLVMASQLEIKPSEVHQMAKKLRSGADSKLGPRLAAAALERTELEIDYDEAYQSLADEIWESHYLRPADPNDGHIEPLPEVPPPHDHTVAE